MAKTKSDFHRDRFKMDIPGLTGRIMAQDMLLRRILLHIVALQSAIEGRVDLQKHRDMLSSWLDDLTNDIEAMRIPHEAEAEIKRNMLSSIHMNIGDIINAIEEAAAK